MWNKDRDFMWNKDRGCGKGRSFMCGLDSDKCEKENDFMCNFDDNQKRGAGRQIFRLAMLLHRFHHKNKGGFGEPLRGQGRVLALLSMKDEGILQRELKFLLDIRPQTLGEILAKLENAGHIEREPLENDKRGYLVKLTESGRLLAASNAERAKEAGKAFDCLSESEKQMLEVLLQKVIDSLQRLTL